MFHFGYTTILIELKVILPLVGLSLEAINDPFQRSWNNSEVIRITDNKYSAIYYNLEFISNHFHSQLIPSLVKFHYKGIKTQPH